MLLKNDLSMSFSDFLYFVHLLCYDVIQFVHFTDIAGRILLFLKMEPYLITGQSSISCYILIFY